MTANGARRDLGADCSCATFGGYDSLCVIHGPKAQTVRPVAPPSTLTEERVREVVRAAIAEEMRLVPAGERPALYDAIAARAAKELAGSVVARSEQIGATAKLDALLAAATAVSDHSVSVLKYSSGDRVWHVVTISLGDSIREEVHALAAEYGAPLPIDRIRGTHRWLESRFEVPGTTITLSLQGAWRRLAESDDTAATPA